MGENLFRSAQTARRRVCGPHQIGEQVEWLEWVDGSRFLRGFGQGPLARPGPGDPIAEDPSFDAAACRDDSVRPT
jgi:hypothetical protein